MAVGAQLLGEGEAAYAVRADDEIAAPVVEIVQPRSTVHVFAQGQMPPDPQPRRIGVAFPLLPDVDQLVACRACCGETREFELERLGMSMVMGVSMRGGLSAALAIDPAAVAFRIVLLLPDRQALLDLVDDVPAGCKGLVAMRGCHTHPHRDPADCELADPMHAGDAPHTEPVQRLGDDPFASLEREGLVRFVLEPEHLATPVVISDPAPETRVTAAGGAGGRRSWPLRR